MLFLQRRNISTTLFRLKPEDKLPQTPKFIIISGLYSVIRYCVAAAPLISPTPLLTVIISLSPSVNSATLNLPLPKNDYVLCVNAVGRTYEFSYPDIDFDGNGYYLKNIDAVTDGIFADTVVRPKDAEVRVSPELDEPFTYVKERSGTGINRRKLAEDISAALKCGGRVVNAETEELFPSVTLADLKAETRPLSVFETVYSFSGEARKSNIALACDYIGYRRIAPASLREGLMTFLRVSPLSSI